MLSLHFSRPVLIALILFCLAAITALDIWSNKSSDLDVLPIPKQAPLSVESWKASLLTSLEIPVSWQNHSGDLHIGIVFNDKKVLWKFNNEYWPKQLKQKLASLESNDTDEPFSHLGIAISGPLSSMSSEKEVIQQQSTFVSLPIDTTPIEVQWITAAVEHWLSTTSLHNDAIHQCEFEHPLGFAITHFQLPEFSQPSDDYPDSSQVNGQLNEQIPSVNWDPGAWQQHRADLSRSLRFLWLDVSRQVDFVAQLAYHRHTPSFFLKLYDSLNQARPTTVKEFHDCQRNQI